VLAFQKLDITYRPADKNRSQLYAAFEPLLNSGQVELLDQPNLLPQLIGLVRKGEKIDHLNGEHDDHANACAGAVVMAAAESMPFMFFSGGRAIGTSAVEANPVPSIEAPSFVARARAALGHAAERLGDTISSVTDAIATTGKAIGQAVAPSEPLPTPSFTGKPRSIEAIRSLAPGCRSQSEQQRLDEHDDREQRRRQPSDFEKEVRDSPGGWYFPTDGGHRLPMRDLHDELEQVRAKFQQWR
jgi:hypothetical protein